MMGPVALQSFRYPFGFQYRDLEITRIGLGAWVGSRITLWRA